MKHITILIPCLNEEKGIGRVIDEIPVKYLRKLGYTTSILVIDNNSTDKTSFVASKKKAKVITESRTGKGYAIRKGLKYINKNTDYIVMIDGDNTYKSGEILRLIEPLSSGFCDAIVGSRLGGKINRDAIKFPNRVANWMFTFLVRQIYRGANITDTLSGYFAWKKEVINQLSGHLTSKGFEIEMEMITKMVKLGFKIYSVPITYDKREGSSKIRAITDGLKILSVYLSNLNWRPKKTGSSPSFLRKT